MFYPMITILQENKVYYPKINNADVYLDFIEKKTMKIMNQRINIKIIQNYMIKKEFDWLYYYVYVILFIDFDSNIDRELYEKIIADMVVLMQM